MIKKRVLVLGSKPEAEFGDFDYAYCANAAASFYKTKLAANPDNVTSLISASELVENKRIGNAEKTLWLRNKLPMLVDDSKTKIYLLNYDYYPEAHMVVACSSFSGECESISSSSLAEIQHSVLGMREPIWTKYHKNVPARELVRNLREFLIDSIKIFINETHQISGLFRPSTGVI